MNDPVICILGLQSPFKDSITELVGTIMHTKWSKQPHCVNANDLAQFAEGFLQAPLSPKIILSDRPSQELSDAIINGKIPTLILYDSAFFEAARIDAHGVHSSIDIARDIQVKVASFAYVETANKAQTLRFGAKNLISQDSAHIERIAKFLNIDPLVLEKFIAENRPVIEQDYTPDFASETALALKSIDNYFNRSRKAIIACTHDFFITGQDAQSLEDGTIDLTGRAGIAFYGPYLPLTPESWLGRLVLWVDDKLLGQRLTFQFRQTFEGEVDELCVLSYQFDRVGRHEISHSFDISRVDRLLEILVTKEQALFEGNVKIEYFTCQRIEQTRDRTTLHDALS